MALSGKLIGYVEITSKKEDISRLFRYDPEEIVVISPAKVHGCELHDGERGASGSVISWDYTEGGKRKICKQIIEPADDGSCMIVFKVIGGDLLEEELYKSFTIILHFEKKGDDEEVAAWTFEFMKPEISVPYPISLMDFLCDLVKDLDAHFSTK